MATTYNIRYKNNCIPQEKILSADINSRYHLDSDCGKKLAGEGSMDHTDSRGYSSSVSITESATNPLGGGVVTVSFLFVRNTGDSDILISLDNAGSLYLIVISSGEAFSLALASGGLVRFKTGAGETSTAEIFYLHN